ncbi:NIL domain-containing protein [Frankia sp. Cpl3]|nr:NIL domain-containing protein [Frankia sp. Cpl3]
MQETGTPFNILQGTISRMKETPYGQLVVELEGDEERGKKTIEALRSRGLEVEVF